MTNGGDRVLELGPALRARREALGETIDSLARKARISSRALQYAENDERAGPTVAKKIATTLTRLEAGETIEEQPHILRLELRPGVFVTVDADNAARLGDLREVEAQIRRLVNGATD